MAIDLIPGFGAFAPVAGSTWNSADQSGITLANGDRDATGSTWGSVRGTTSKSTQKFHFEVEALVAGTSIGIGIGNASAPLTTNVNYLGETTDSLCYYGNTGQVYVGGTVPSTLSTWTPSDIIAVEGDATAELIWFAKNAGNWNDSGSADPATGTGGISFSGLNAGPWFIACSVFNGGSLRIRTVSSQFSRAISSGFSEWG